MEVLSLQQRMLTHADHLRLTRLLAGRGDAAAMQDLLDGSDLVPSRTVPPTIVTMRSRVLLRDPAGAAPPYELTLCYPDEADASRGAVSVLSPVGSALLGLPVGATARWSGPGGRSGAARILSLSYQPEAAGEFEA